MHQPKGPCVALTLGGGCRRRVHIWGRQPSPGSEVRVGPRQAPGPSVGHSGAKRCAGVALPNLRTSDRWTPDGPALPGIDPLPSGRCVRWQRRDAEGRGDCRPRPRSRPGGARFEVLLKPLVASQVLVRTLTSPASCSIDDDLETTDFESHLCTLKVRLGGARSTHLPSHALAVSARSCLE